MVSELFIFIGDDYLVYIDSREPENIIKMSRKFFEDIEVATLPCSDIMCGNVAVERKTIGDFASSVHSKRVFKQAKMMKETFDKPFIIIVGDPASLRFTKINFKIENYLGAVASLSASTGVPCLTVKNMTQFFNLSRKLFEKGNRDPTDIKDIVWAKPKTPNIHAQMLACVPGIGVNKAVRILKEFSYNELFTASEKDLQRVKGIGKKHSQNIKKYYNFN